ncbi:MAG: FkbM family methyltransferase [Clostridia bacterium]|jgi:FkbM family methyltransferase|nr:FkbM family methyltransferase [Clostridia bacterium]
MTLNQTKKKSTMQMSAFDQMLSPSSYLNQNRSGASKFFNANKKGDLKNFAKVTKDVWFHQWCPLCKHNIDEMREYQKERDTICWDIIEKYKQLEAIETGDENKKDYLSTPFGLKLSVAEDVNPYEFVRDYYDVIYSDITAHIVDKKFRTACGSGFLSFLENVEFNGGWCSSFSAPKKEDIILDIGGGYGMFALVALKLGAKRVYVFEPNTQARNIIKRNRDLNGYTQDQMPIFKYAFSDVVGSAYLYNKSLYPCSGVIQYVSPDNPAYKNQNYEIVDVITLDDFIHKMEFQARQESEDTNTPYVKPKIDFIKIHTNGSEHLVLKGGTYLLQWFELPDLVINTYFSPYEYKLTREIIDANTYNNSHYIYQQRKTKFHASADN